MHKSRFRLGLHNMPRCASLKTQTLWLDLRGPDSKGGEGGKERGLADFPSSTPDLWMTSSDHFNKSTQPSIPPGSVN